MTDKNPFSDKHDNPLTGKEIEWLNWNSDKRQKNNPHIDKDGNISSYDGFSNYRLKIQKEYQEDLLKLPVDLRQELENETQLLSERMQVEATGRR